MTPPAVSSPDLSEKDVDKDGTSDDSHQQTGRVPKTKAFYLVMVAICCTLFLSAIDLTAVSTALPTIALDLHMQSPAWVGSAYAISSTAFMPLAGSMAMIFGRRKVLVTAVLVFALGSALSGAAQNGPMIIAGRTVQGVGGGAILALSEILVTDLVPQVERGLWMGVLGMVWAFASLIGPVIGGALGGSNWRWLFYLNLPFCGLSLLLIALYLNFRVPATTLQEKLRQIDFANIIFVGGIVSLLLGLTMGGNAWPWSDYRTILSLVVGGLLLPVWLFLEKNYVKAPTVPWAIVSNRSALSSEIAAFLHGMVVLMVIYYGPVWPQATKGASPIISGLFLGPLALSIAPAGIICGIAITVTQRYRIFNLIGWVLFLLGVGLLGLISSSMPVGQWVGFQLIVGVGAGLLYTAPNFPILASLPVELHALGVALLNFSRSLGQAVGITIGYSLLTSKLNAELPVEYTSSLPGGSQSAYASIRDLAEVAEPLRSEVRQVYGEALSFMFKVSIAFAALGLLSVALMKELKLHTMIDERYAHKDLARSERKTLAAPTPADAATHA